MNMLRQKNLITESSIVLGGTSAKLNLIYCAGFLWILDDILRWIFIDENLLLVFFRQSTH